MRTLTLALACSFSSAALAQQAEFTSLGFLPGAGGLYSEANGVNEDGTVVVGRASGASAFRAFRWTAAGGMVDLGNLPGGTVDSWATGVSADGTVVVGHADPTGSNETEAFRWMTSTGMVGLGHLPGGMNQSSQALGVSADGSVIVGIGHANQGPEAALWRGGAGPLSLHQPGWTVSVAFAVSADGTTAVGYSHNGWFNARRWTSAGAMALGNLPGTTQGSLAIGVSADGSVVVGYDDGRSFRWTVSGGMNEIPTLPSPTGVRLSGAWAVSGDGRVIVGDRYDGGTGPWAAWFWTEPLGMTDLRTYLVTHGATGLAGWSLGRPHALTFDGTVVVGVGINPSGDGEAYLARIPLDHTIGTSYCTPATPNSTGQAGVIHATGSVRVANDDVTLTASRLPPSMGYFLVGRTQGFFNPPGSQGLICLSGNIGRYNQVANIIQGPTGSIQLDLTAIPVNPPQAVVPGDTWNFQCWYRDANPGPTSNFTDAVSVMFN